VRECSNGDTLEAAGLLSGSQPTGVPGDPYIAHATDRVPPPRRPALRHRSRDADRRPGICRRHSDAIVPAVRTRRPGTVVGQR